MAWSPQQEQCLKALTRFADNDEPCFLLFGDAGTGKTTLSIEFPNIVRGRQCKAYAYTGKAASVLRAKGHHDAGTLHSDLYIPAMQSKKRLEGFEARYVQAAAELDRLQKQPCEGAEQLASMKRLQATLSAEIEELRRSIAEERDALSAPQFTLNTQSPMRDLDFIIVDECSFIGTRLGLDIEKICREAGVKMLVMGDPNQLPPVKDKGHFIDRKPDSHLTEPHRQAQDNPIIHMAHRVKNGQGLPIGKYGESEVSNDVTLQECLEADQMLVGINETRQYYNRRLREEKGYTDLVEVGEKLMCLRNSKEGFFNGQIWYAEEVHDFTPDGERLCLTLRSEDVTQPTRQALVHTKVLKGEDIHWMDAQGAQSMVSAQAVTVHKFQGSEGNDIVLMDESYRCCREFPHRWLYTGVTRARRKVKVGR
jgi:exodeoxyribonuclease-5